jgi:hypothetical protein
MSHRYHNTPWIPRPLRPAATPDTAGSRRSSSGLRRPPRALNRPDSAPVHAYSQVTAGHNLHIRHRTRHRTVTQATGSCTGGARETRDALAVLLQCAQNQITCRMRIVRRDSAQVDRRSHSIIRVKESAICASRLLLVSTTKVARKLLGMNTLEPLWLCFLFVPSLRCVALKPPPAVLGVETWPPP